MAGFVSSLPAAVHPYLKLQLDRDNHDDADLKEITNHMEAWDSNLATHLNLTEKDRDNIYRKYNTDPVSQR